MALIDKSSSTKELSGKTKWQTWSIFGIAGFIPFVLLSGAILPGSDPVEVATEEVVESVQEAISPSTDEEKATMNKEVQAVYETRVTPENWQQVASQVVLVANKYCLLDKVDSNPNPDCLKAENTKTYLGKPHFKLLSEAAQKTISMKEQVENLETQRTEEERQAAISAAMPIRYKATINNCVPLGQCRTINGSAWISDQRLYLNIDESCPLAGYEEHDWGAHMGCKVTMKGDKPVRYHEWAKGGDEWDNEITAAIGEPLENPSASETENPFVREYQERVNNMMKQWNEEEEKAKTNCKGKTGEEWVKCAGKQ